MNKLRCDECGSGLTLRTPNRTRRAGVSVLRLECKPCRINYLANDEPFSRPYRTHKPCDENLRKRVRSIRLSDLEMQSIEDGKLRLVVIGRRITLAV